MEKKTLADKYEDIIRHWLRETFGNEDALPNLILKGLSQELASHGWEVCQHIRKEYDLEDINRAAVDREIELTDEEAEIVLNKYQDSEYQDVDTIDYLLDIVIEMRKEKDNA